MFQSIQYLPLKAHKYREDKEALKTSMSLAQRSVISWRCNFQEVKKDSHVHSRRLGADAQEYAKRA